MSKGGRARKQLPLPEEASPFPPKTHRALPAIPKEDDTPAPPVPSRPGAHRPPPPPPGGQKVPSRNPLDNERLNVRQQQENDSNHSGAESDSSYEEMDQPPPPGTPPRRYKESGPIDRSAPPLPNPKPRKKRNKQIPLPPPNFNKPAAIVQSSKGPNNNVTKSITSDDGDQEPGLYADAEEGDIYEDEPPDNDSFQQEEYDEFTVGPEDPPEQEEYDEFDVGGPVEEQENYDDFEEGQTAYEMEPPLPAPPVAEDFYEAVPDPPPSSRVPPARPAPSVPSPSVPVPPPAPPVEEMYEAVPEPAQSAPTPPPARKQDAKPYRAPPKIPDRESERSPPPVPKGRGGGGQGLAIDLSALQNKRGNLRKVGKPVERQDSDPHDVKEYGDTSELKSPFEIFKAREKASGGNFPVLKKTPSSESTGKPAVTSPKPSVTSPTAENKSVTRPSGPSSLPHAPNTNKNIPRPKSSPPPPPIDRERPPLPSGHPPLAPSNRDKLPPPPPSTGSLPTPPVKKDNYSQVNKPGGTNSPPVINGGVQQEEENDGEWPDSDSDGEIYDDAISNIDPLRDYPWYFGEIERTAGNRFLKDKAGNGAYLVRKSARGGDDQPYTLMVMYNDHIYNLKVRIDKKQRFALGEEKSDEISFKTVPDLISHHQKNDVILVHKSGARYETVLKTIPNKP